MQLASSGARLAARHARPSGASRSIHIGPAFRATPFNSGVAQKLLNHSRSLITSFFTHLTTPGTLRSSFVPPVARSLHGSTRPSIRNNLSFPVRTILSHQPKGPFFPQAPSIPRSTFQVGLNTARNFSSARPIFQNLVENVPITGRAFLETDWEIKKRKENIRKPVKRKSSKTTRGKGKEMNKSRLESNTLKQVTPVAEEVNYHTEMDRYFDTPPVPKVTTYLLIPLAPTPTARVPLPPSTSPHSSLLPLPALTSLHDSYSTHNLRVSSLFARLDTANVWNRGVTCSPFAHGSSSTGNGGGAVCAFLKVEFTGWTMAEVRGVIGESGTGWCVLDEQREDGIDDETSSIFSSEMDEDSSRSVVGPTVDEMDPAKSFILPTLDFSSSFIGATSPPPDSAMSQIDSLGFGNSDFDPQSDGDSDSCSDYGSDFSCASSVIDSVISAPSVVSDNPSWFKFSSDFANRAISSEYEPRENLF